MRNLMQLLKELIFLYKNFNFEFNLLSTCRAIDSPLRVSSRMHPKYFTLEYCLIILSSYFIINGLAFLAFRLLANRIHLVLSSPKWILSLLFMNQLHRSEKFLVNTFSIWFISLCWYIMQESSAYKSKSQDIACGISFM